MYPEIPRFNPLLYARLIQLKKGNWGNLILTKIGGKKRNLDKQQNQKSLFELLSFKKIVTDLSHFASVSFSLTSKLSRGLLRLPLKFMNR